MDEKPFPPSSKKLLKARKQGEYPLSDLLVVATLLGGGVLLFWLFFRKALPAFWTNALGALQTSTFEEGLFALFKPLFLPWTLFLISMWLLTFSIYFVQRGWVFSWPKRAKRGFTVEWLFPLLKLALVSLLLFLFLLPLYDSLGEKSDDLLKRALSFLFVGALALGTLGALEYLYRKKLFLKKMRMTHAEVKKELKESEGSQLSKQRRNKR